jgi:NADPH:quinone reductase-like Zn-dependent oxidoreductase
MMFAEAVEVAAERGRIPVITAPRDGMATFNLRNVYRKNLRIVGVDSRPLDVVACANLLAELAPGFEAGRFTVKPGRTFPLGSAIEAYEQAAKGGARITLRPDL